jgi:hypothetical protein
LQGRDGSYSWPHEEGKEKKLEKRYEEEIKKCKRVNEWKAEKRKKWNMKHKSNYLMFCGIIILSNHKIISYQKVLDVESNVSILIRIHL